MLGQFTRNDLPFRWLKERHKTELFRRSTDGVPRNPHAVGRPKLRARLMLGELLGREHIFAIGLIVIRA